ncbi:P-loop containing nucleoside triphosphate hydrolase protein [Amniculicola lignicola CBS 123094]|uniref:ATP-dependent RNA helicase ROK1 n=1 Tax=Amniculicola lignicola CBS 123094 TaxID=1392246 RepID=A0A6A5W1B9_9PLEO|nr:P-loop containing nucleoside triphosphate hydrolase protein [Amniculicola lignicola CBS 123094]
MNVFKLLSRSAKGPLATPTTNLPSSGAVANPQLFGHGYVRGEGEMEGRGRKRKRGGAGVVQGGLPVDLDFFGGEKKEGRGRGEGHGEEEEEEEEMDGGGKRERVEQEDRDRDRDVDEGKNGEGYDADECKRVLRLHKLKITVLEDFVEQEEESQSKEKEKAKKKSKKRRKKEEEAAAKAKKNGRTQLFPQPLTAFDQLRERYGISRRLAENLAEQGYTVPTEVQLAALPLLLGKKKRGDEEDGMQEKTASGEDLAGKIDLLSVAPTGSGKTIAFLIPIINALLAENKTDAESGTGPRAVIIAPTKELASQIANEAHKLAKGTRVKAALMKKGMEVVERSEDTALEEDSDMPDVSDEEADSDAESDGGVQLAVRSKRQKRRAEIVKAAIIVATPLALLNALKHRDGTVSELPSVQHLVLDEADVLLDPLFREQTVALWNACTNPLLRAGLWSATMGSNIEALSLSTLNDRWTALSTSSPTLPPRPPLVRLVVGLKDTAIPNITHKLIYAATEQGKLLGLRQLLHPTAIPSTDTTPSLRPPFLVFTQTIPRAIALHSELLYDIPPEAGGSLRIAVLHADLSSTARDLVMTRFRRGEIWVLITTDLLARGVDFRGLNGVVNYDVPNSAAAYVHRVGRTGRAGREGGVAVTFYTKDDVPYIKNVANVIRASEKLRHGEAGGSGADEGTVKQWLLDALPTPSKRDKKELRRGGVESRRKVKDGEGRGRGRISTKSGFERRVENKKRGAKMASLRGNGVERKEEGSVVRRQAVEGGESEFEGFE